MKHIPLSVAVLHLVFRGAAAAQQTPAPEITDIQVKINLVKAALPHLKVLEPWLLGFLLATIALALASSIIQSFEKTWVKRATVILGAIIAAIGGLKSTIYVIDYRTCDQVVRDMEGVIGLLESEIKEYEKDGLPDAAREQFFKLIVGNVGTLQKLDGLLRASGQGVLPPPGFVVVALAQSQSPKQAAPYYTIRHTGNVVASTKTAGYEYARYQALEQIALRELNSSPVKVDAAIQYLERFAEPASSDCRPEGKMFNCTVEMTLTSVYLSPRVIQRFRGDVGARPKAEIRGQGAFPSAARSISVSVGKTGKGKMGGFEFTLVHEARASPLSLDSDLELSEIKSFEAGRWAFEIISADGFLGSLPLNHYDDGGQPTLYRLTPPKHVLRQFQGGQVTIIGYQPGPPASAQ
jgi:hypothetical protein